MKPGRINVGTCCTALVIALLPGALHAQSRPLRVGMTLSDIAITTGQPDAGAEGYRYSGYTLYDALINWRLDDPKLPPTLAPGLATEWKVDEKDRNKWLFTLRKGVKFHDGSDFNADAVVWNMEKIYNKAAAQYDPKQATQARPRLTSLKSWRKVDDYTVEFTTSAPDSTFPRFT